MRTLLDSDLNEWPERRTAFVARELRRFNVDIAALSETRLAEEGQLREERPFFWKGRPAGEPRIHGVGFAIKTNLVRQLTELPQGISKRLMTVRLKLDSNRMATVVGAYAPTLDSQEDIKEAFYASLDNILSAIPKEDKIIFLREFNDRMGRDYTTALLEKRG